MNSKETLVLYKYLKGEERSYTKKISTILVCYQEAMLASHNRTGANRQNLAFSVCFEQEN